MFHASPGQQGTPPADARALVLVAHPDGASLSHAGHAFVADVLRANGFATLPFCLHAPEEAAAGMAPPGLVQGRWRVRSVLHWLAEQPSLGRRPLALIGLGGAAQACIACAAQPDMPPLGAMVLLDAHAEKVSRHLLRLKLPTLFVMGHCDARRLMRQRAALRGMPARHRLQVLSAPTLPQPAPGALEAFACSALDWLDQALPQSGAQPCPGQIAARVRRDAMRA
ncbi:MAG: hypothetical protein ACRC2B_07070 [Rubrivivax sp.]